jgi:hypothetical protein
MYWTIVVLDEWLTELGMELITDLCLAHVLMKKGFSKIVFHGKQFPWFVSDVTAQDLEWTVNVLPKDIPLSQDTVSQWKKWIQLKQWEFHYEPFWTLYHSFWQLKEQDEALYQSLFGPNVSLVVFKGDLNYRKLVQDVDWPPNTLFSTALGPLSQNTILTLRTCKSDPCCGLTREQILSMNQKDSQWRVNGKYGMIHGDD